jgi:endonuclease YncB( thermonuclease family)
MFASAIPVQCGYHTRNVSHCRRTGPVRLLFAALLLLPLSVGAETLVGRVVRVVDGDTVYVLDTAKTQHKIRLGGIDGPERG